MADYRKSLTSDEQAQAELKDVAKKKGCRDFVTRDKQAQQSWKRELERKDVEILTPDQQAHEELKDVARKNGCRYSLTPDQQANN